MSKHQFTDIRVAIEPDNPSIQRLEFKCIKCGNCKTVCTDYIGVCGTYDLKATGDKPICINCGQCANMCPVDSITEKVEAYQVMAEIRDAEKIVIFSTSPSVRIALGEEFGMPDGSFVEGKMVSLLRKLGADYVLDTNFAADLTIVEEASELLQRITKGTRPLLPAAARRGLSLPKLITPKCCRIFPVPKALSACRGLPLKLILRKKWASTRKKL